VNAQSRNILLIFAAIAIAALAAGCSDTTQPSPAVREYAQAAIPADTRIAEIYQRSCMACHSRGTSEAPLTGHGTAWRLRMEQGMDSLVANVISGMGGMPPYGLCMDCNGAEFEALITFMATPARP